MYPCGPSHSHHSRSHHWVLVVRWYRPGQSHDLGYEPSEYAPSLQSAVGRGTIPTLGSPCTPSYRQGKSLGTMLTDLEKAMDSLIDVYHKYSLVKGNYHAVYKEDLKKLLETECPQYTKVRRGWCGWGSLPGSEEALSHCSPVLLCGDSQASALPEIFRHWPLSPQS